ncbi:MAG: hypothetical protein AB1585_21850 [Thermodesulfobacteriota bacterium]
MIDAYDTLEAYCNQLGMTLNFQYCRRSQGTLPCRNLIGCWQERIPVNAFLQEHFSKEALQKLFGRLPKSRIERILEGVEKERGKPQPDKNSP